MLIQERDFDILAWVDHMGFPNIEQVTRALFRKGSNPHRAPYRRMLKLKKEGLIDTCKVAIDPRDLYVITRDGVALLKSVDFQYVPGVPKKKMLKNYEHDSQLIDLRIFFQELGVGVWVPERVIRSIKPRGSSPDALVITWDANYAVEYELNEKDAQRYKQIFERYATKEKYDGVLYILPTESRIKKLRSKLPLIDKKIYFLSEEKLYPERENAVFYSTRDGLPLKRLIRYSLNAPLEEVELKTLKEIIQSEPPDAWKERKPLIPFGGGGGHKHGEESSWDNEEDTGPSVDPLVNPLIGPDEGRAQEEEDF